MGAKVFKRFTHMLGVLVILSVVLYYMLGLMPGDPVDLLVVAVDDRALRAHHCEDRVPREGEASGVLKIDSLTHW